MMQINLLPWREQRREIKKRRFILLSSIVAALTLLLLISIHFYLKSFLNDQLALNSYLQTAIDSEQKTFNEMTNRKHEEIDVNAQLNLIISLYSQSYRAIRALNTFVTLTPNTIQLERIQRKGNMITLVGTAPSESIISDYMVALEKSHEFSQPILTNLAGGKVINGTNKHFELNMDQME